MEGNFSKDYIKTSNEFRTSNASKESVEKLYDLLYDLKNSNRTKKDSLTLSNVYRLLGFHQSAYEIFKSVVDLTDRKNASKLYAMEEKAKSHKNNFIIKDIRKYRGKNKQLELLPTDFLISEPDENKFNILNKDVIIFNKVVKSKNVEIYIYGNHKFKNYVDRIINYIYWLGNCDNALIEYYNSVVSEYYKKIADKDWFDTLEVFNARIIVGENGNLYAEISCEDDFSQDHILDIETENEKITSMNYDG